MKKKLAIFTAAVGFFTLCNVILYTRKLRADEMVSFWRWSITAAEAATGIKNSNNNNNNNYSTYLADDQRELWANVTTIATRSSSSSSSYPVHHSAVISVGQKQKRVLSSLQQRDDTVTSKSSNNRTYSTNAAALNRTLSNATTVTYYDTNQSSSSSSSVSPTTTTFPSSEVTKPSSTVSSTTTTATTTGSSCWSLIEAIMNRTYRYNVNESTASVQVSFQLPLMRNFTVTFNISLIDEQYGLDFFDDEISNAAVSTLTPTLGTSDINNSSSTAAAVAIGNWTTEISVTTAQMSAAVASSLPSKSTYHLNKRPPDGMTSTTTNPKKGLSPLNEHPFSYLVNVEDLCKSTASNLTLVILVTTAIGHAAHRQAIRDTWGGLVKSLSDARLAFLVGRPERPTDEANILREALRHADIVQEDFVDTYKNLTLKSVMLLKWANKYCPNSRYVMKTDDDMFINVPNLLKYLRSLRYNKGQLLGRLVRGARPLRTRSSKYYVPMSEYKDRIYPDYLSGTAYVMSSDVVPRLHSTSRTTPIFFFEDVFVTGICAKKAKVVRRNHSGFVYYKRPVKGCAYLRAISGHDNTPNDLRKIWRELQRKNLKC